MSAGLPLVLPRPLEKGCTVGVCAPAGPVDDAALDAGLAWLEAAGYAPRCAPHLRSRSGFLAGRDDERAADLVQLLRDPEVRGIVLARGGYGLSRILGRLTPLELRTARKLMVGYSDATALLLLLQRRAGLASVHGPMLERPELSDEARARWLAVVRGEPGAFEPLRGNGLREGRVRGPLVGGNLTALASSLGTPWELDARGAILFLEEVCEEPYAIDRMVVQLREAGKLCDVAGVAIGQLVSCSSTRYPEPTAREVLRELLMRVFEGPIVEDLPFGHVHDHRALGFGVRAELDGSRGTLTMLDPVVEVDG
ncbi:MAG: LD-carboxypeptidase [Myxococcota bacterium]